MNGAPQRIVCLCAAAADWLWRLGAWEKVVGITAFYSLPAGAIPKRVVSGFSAGNTVEIARLKPDLVITFSDVQAKLAGELIQGGFNVIATNQRTLAEIEVTLALIARIVGCESVSEQLLSEWRARLALVNFATRKPRVYFEEWNDPLISGISWISELIERAGGQDVFAHLSSERSSANRAVTHSQVAQANPEIIFASWCGKPFTAQELQNRPDWNQIAAIQSGYIYEIPGDEILQPGFRLVEGFVRLQQAILSVTRQSDAGYH